MNKIEKLDYLKSWAKKYEEVNLSIFLKNDLPRLEITRFILELIFGSTNLNFFTDSGNYVISDPMGNRLLQFNEVSLEIQAAPDLIHKIIVLLNLIRIHEVESYDWVWMSPDAKDKLLSNFLLSKNIQRNEWNNARALWLSNK